MQLNINYHHVKTQGSRGEPWCEGQVVLMRTSACSVRDIVAEMRHIHTDYPVLWRKGDSTATLSSGECPFPCLDRLLLLFWAHYIEDGPCLLCTGSL